MEGTNSTEAVLVAEHKDHEHSNSRQLVFAAPSLQQSYSSPQALGAGCSMQDVAGQRRAKVTLRG